MWIYFVLGRRDRLSWVVFDDATGAEQGFASLEEARERATQLQQAYPNNGYSVEQVYVPNVRRD